ncbi:MAG: hypothetical protein EOP06_30930, partial [Proteobacteria bacterium]
MHSFYQDAERREIWLIAKNDSISAYSGKRAPSRKNKWLGVFFGMFFGLLFPILGTSLECLHTFEGNAPPDFRMEQVLAVHARTPLLWVIDFFPVVMAAMGYLVSSRSPYRSLLGASPARKGLALLLTVFTFLPAFPLFFALYIDNQQDRATLDVNIVGSLCTSSISIYRYSREGNDSSISERAERRRAIRNELQSLATIREKLRTTYPVAVAATDRAWMSFADPLRRTGKVEWFAAEKMMLATNIL